MRCAAVTVMLFGLLIPAALGDPKGTQAPPKGAQFTIFCTRIEGASHVEIANRLKNELTQKTGLNDWYVVHDEQQSLLYFGFYKAFNDPTDKKETARAQTDLRKIKSLSADGARLFPAALFVDLEAPDPVAPPEWNLLNAKGVWSVQIAAYRDSPQRKDAAVDAVREARKQGVEAYFYHGETISSVCIGAWPEEAVVIEAESKEPVGPMDSVLVTPAGMPEMTGVRGEQGVKVVKERVRVVDPSLLAVMKQYPYHAVNGMQTVRNVNGQDVIDPSLLIVIPKPKEESSGLAGGSRDGAPAASDSTGSPADPPTARPAPPPSGSGKLKSIDD